MLSFARTFDKHLMKESMEERVLRHLRAPGSRPLNKSELARALEIPSKDRSALRECLREMELAGTLLRGKKERFQLATQNSQTVMGTFRSRREGGVVHLEETKGQSRRSVRISDGHSGTALDGDLVQVRLRRQESTEDPHWLKHLPAKKQEQMQAKWAEGERPVHLQGEVIQVLERSPRKVVGTLSLAENWAWLKPDDERLPQRIDLPNGAPPDAQSGDKAIVRIDGWESIGRAPEGTLVKALGHPDAPGVDVLTIIHKHGLPTEFPADVLAEAAAVSEAGIEHDDTALAREDWRDEEVFTIDPFDARDFDDAIAVKSLEDEGWELAVHIADVSHYVQPGSALDREAAKRGNSVYLVDRVLPMLPESLSNGICSLRPDEERFTFCAVLRFDAQGRRTSARFTPAVIRSQLRMTYEEAFSRLQGQGPEDSITAGAPACLGACVHPTRSAYPRGQSRSRHP